MPLFLASLLLKIGIPERLHKATLIVVAVFVLISAFGIWLAVHDHRVVEADRNAGNAKATTIARKADEGAQQASESKKDAVEQGNKDAEEAARQSDDPLADGLRKLRAKPAH